MAGHGWTFGICKAGGQLIKEGFLPIINKLRELLLLGWDLGKKRPPITNEASDGSLEGRHCGFRL